MSREEAIEFGNMWLQINEDCKDSSTYTFFQMAIKALENHDTFMKYAYSQGKQDALSQEPCTDAVSREDEMEREYEKSKALFHKIVECEDAISRDAVKKWVCKTCPDDAECQRDCDVIKGIDALPSVTQKSDKYRKEAKRWKNKWLKSQKSGKWIIIDDCEKFIAKCSECGRIEDSRMIGKYPYCHCGAKMESEDEE